MCIASALKVLHAFTPFVRKLINEHVTELNRGEVFEKVWGIYLKTEA